MDPRLRLHHGFVADPASHLMAGGAPLQDLSSINLLHSQLAARQDLAQARLQGGVPAAGQGFYTVESLQASAVPRPEDLARQSQLFGVGQQGYDSLALSHALAQQAASAGISIAAGQQGLDAAGLSHLLAQQAANQRLIGGYAGSGLQSLSTEALAQLAQQVASQRLGQQGLDNPALAHLRMQQAARLGQNLPPLTGLSAYGQPDVSLASARLGMLAPQDVTLLLLEREKRLKEILLEQERERYREQDRQRERLREKDRRAERDRERGRDSDRRKKRETSTDKRDTPEKRDSRGVLLIRRLPDPLDKEKGKTSESHDKKEKTWCHLCQLLCTSQDMFEKHVAGKQHKLRVQAEAEAEVLKVELSKSKDAKAKRDDKSSKGDKDKTRKEKVTDTRNTKEKPREKRNRHRRKSKSDKIESKSKSDEPAPEEKPIILKTDEGTETIQEVLENPILPETGEESEKAQGVLEQLGSETDATHKIEIESKEVQIEVEDSNIHGTTDLSVKEKESDVATQGEGVESVLGKRTLEVAGDPPLAKKTRKGKVAAAAPGTVRCEVCKLTCRNAAVYETHLVGEKHAERLKKAQDQAVTQT